MKNKKIFREFKTINRKSQSSTELILVIAIFLIVIATVLYYTGAHFSIIEHEFNIGQARNVLRIITHESDRVYQAGEGSTSRIFLPVPDGINETKVINKTIEIKFKNGQSTHHNTEYTVRGFIPKTSSWLNIVARNGYVQFYLDIFDITPRNIYTSLMRTNSSTTTLILSNSLDEDINVNVSLSISDPEINVTLSAYNFTTAIGNQALIAVNITVSSNASYGKHYSELKLRAISANSSKDMETTVPIIVDVIYDTNASSGIEAIMGVLPGTWNTSLYSNQVATRYFYAFSGFPTDKNMTLWFSGIGSTYASFAPLPNISVQNITLDIAAKDNKQFSVYLSPTSSATPGNYTTYLNYQYEKEIYGMNVTVTGSILISLEVYFDNAAPIVANTTSSSLIAANGSNICIYSDIIDDNGINTVTMAYNYNNQSAQYLSMTMSGCYSGKYSTYLNLPSIGTYRILNVTAYDLASNVGYEITNISIDAIAVTYTTPFNGTITENIIDSCYMNGSRTWNASLISYNLDGQYINIPDDNWSSTIACGYEKADFVQFNFTGIDIYNRNVTSASLTFSHKEDKYNGTLPGGVEEFARYMMIQCFNGTAYTDIDIYYPTSTNNSFSDYNNIDISTCIKDRTIANNLSIRITYDPYNSSVNNSVIRTPMQYIDYITVNIATKDFYLLDLWPGPTNFQTRADFKTLLNSSNNTFYINESSIYRTKQLINNSGFTGPSFSGWQTSGNLSLAPGGNVILFSEGFEAAAWNNSWVVVPASGNIARDGSFHTGSWSLAFSQFGAGEGYIYKALNLSGYTNVTLSFYAASEDLESGDEGWLDVYNGTWNNATMQIGPDNNGRTSSTPAQFNYSTISLNSYGLGQDVRIRFRSSAQDHASGSGDKDSMLVDDISVISSDKYTYSDYFYIDSNNQTDYGTVSQNLSLGLSSYDIITSAIFTVDYSIDTISFNGSINAFCNISTSLPGNGGVNYTIWNNTINSSGNNSVNISQPIEEIRNLTSILNNKSATYKITCGAYLSGDSEIAFNLITIDLNYTTRSATDDGWDWQDDTYGHSGAIASTFVKHYDPSGKSDNTTVGAIGLSIGGNNTGSGNLMASGAWGIEEYVNDTVYDAIENHNGRALLSFNYKVVDLLPSTNGINGSAWIKSLFGKGQERNYLGTQLDNLIESNLHYTDDTNEIWYLGDYKYKGFGSDNFGNGTIYRSFSADITSYITSSGPYYLELGGIASWLNNYKTNNEGIMIYFTNIRIIIEYD